MKLIKALFILLVLFLIAVVLILGYFGFIPVLSSVFGSDKPRDLGIKYTQKQYSDYLTKTKTQITALSGSIAPENSLVYSGKEDVKNSFTPEEISARLNYSKWKYMPVTNTQVRINSDGTIEFSALVLYNRLDGFIAREGAGNYSKADVDKGLNYIKLIGRDFPVYAKFRANMINNQLNESTEKIEVGRFGIPLGSIGANNVIKTVAETIVSRVPEFYAKSVKFENSKMYFDGTVPQKVSVEYAK